MAGIKGRTMEVWRGAVLAQVAQVRSKTFSINGEPIDETSDDDDGVRKLMADAAEVTAEISVSGVLAAGHALAAEAENVNGRAINTEFRVGAVEKWAGSFFMTAFTITGEYKGAVTFEATFASAGAVTYTPPA